MSALWSKDVIGASRWLAAKPDGSAITKAKNGARALLSLCMLPPYQEISRRKRGSDSAPQPMRTRRIVDGSGTAVTSNLADPKWAVPLSPPSTVRSANTSKKLEIGNVFASVNADEDSVTNVMSDSGVVGQPSGTVGKNEPSGQISADAITT